MNKNLYILIVCALCVFPAAAQSYSGGSGTAADPYRISSKSDMAVLANTVNNGRNYDGKYFLLTQDITDTVTSIIGTSIAGAFAGIFDGGGHKIIVNINSNIDRVGVFGWISTAASTIVIKNLVVEGAIRRTSNTILGQAGGICGRANGNCKIINCYNFASVSATSSNYGASAGGISGGGGEISNCYNYGNIFATGFGFNSASAGGICAGLTNITNCLSMYGDIYTTWLENNFNNDSQSAGRIAGDGVTIATNIQNCYALATIKINGKTRSSQNTSSPDGKDFVGSVLRQNDNFLFGSNFNVRSSIVTTIFVSTIKPLKWQCSFNDGNSWTDIACTNPFYIETNPVAGHFIYRVQKSDGTYSSNVDVTYSDTNLTEIEEVNALKVSIYPNPAKNILSIKSDCHVKRIEIFNQSGIRVLINDNVSDEIDVSRLANGIYFVKIYMNGMTATKKIVIK